MPVYVYGGETNIFIGPDDRISAEIAADHPNKCGDRLPSRSDLAAARFS
jgi:hypothetical protein